MCFVNAWISDMSVKHIWAPPLVECVRKECSISIWDWHICTYTLLLLSLCLWTLASDFTTTLLSWDCSVEKQLHVVYCEHAVLVMNCVTLSIQPFASLGTRPLYAEEEEGLVPRLASDWLCPVSIYWTTWTGWKESHIFLITPSSSTCEHLVPRLVACKGFVLMKCSVCHWRITF